jgi:hypothetical protein
VVLPAPMRPTSTTWRVEVIVKISRLRFASSLPGVPSGR